MQTPSHIRTFQCGLPPVLAFPPRPSSSSAQRDHEHQSSVDDIGNSNDASQDELVWKNQLRERQLVETGNDRIRWLICQLTTHISTKFIGDVEKQWHSFDVSANDHAAPWTIFDLYQLASTVRTILLNDNAMEFIEWFLMIETVSCKDDKEAEILQYWKHAVKQKVAHNVSLKMTWENLFLHPLKEAAVSVLALYDRIISDSITDSCLQLNGAIQHYLHYQASHTLRHLQHIILPALKQKLIQQQNHSSRVQQAHKDMECKYNSAFEEWENHCWNVLCVKSDKISLFPLDKHDWEQKFQIADENSDLTDKINDAVENYAKTIGKYAIEPMREDLQKLSERFLLLLRSEKGCPKENVTKSKDIFQAIIYYKQFTKFIASMQLTNKQKEQRQEEENDKSMETLCYYISDDNQYTSCITKFMESPLSRTQLVYDLQQLSAFLSCRIRDIIRSSSRGMGVATMEAIELEWAKFCMIQRSTHNLSLMQQREDMYTFLEDIILEDVQRYKLAIDNVLMQIVGDGTNARRLTILADAIGYPYDSGSTSWSSYSRQFKHLCLKAANIFRLMNLYDLECKSMAAAAKQCHLKVRAIEKEVDTLQRRIKCNHEGLNYVFQETK